MPTPAYAFFLDENGEDIEGGVQTVDDDELEITGSVEVIEFSHDLYVPTDKQTGVATGVRTHQPVKIVKAFDQASPILYQACCNGTTLESVTIRWIRITPQGEMEEYFNHLLEKVKVQSIHAFMPNSKDPAKEHFTHLEEVSLLYSKITWTYIDGSIETSDSWLASNQTASE